jgi:L-lactate dehydrogenase complex protein LldG
MTSREKILAQVEANLPAFEPLPVISVAQTGNDLLPQLKKWLEILHVDVKEIAHVDEIKNLVDKNGRIFTTIEGLGIGEYADIYSGDPHDLEDVELAILPGHFAVAENGAIWITEELMGHRVLPFIAQQLALVISKKNIVGNMHEAYEKIGDSNDGFGVFIAGPSKTADIEQSLVLGAHGPKSMMVFIVDDAVA